MFPTDFNARLPPGIALLYLSTLFDLASSHALPRQTKTVAYRELNVLPWPLATPAPASPYDLRRQASTFNTVCGYIGGDPSLPATCSAGSHCAVDVEHGAIGCCPDGGACSVGVYTGCVDGNSDPQTEVNPYVYTCGDGNVCYKNSFEGGYSQYGCGSSSGMGTSVQGTASGKSRVDITSLSVSFTATATSLSEPTTLGTKTDTASETSSDASSSSKSSSSKSSATSTSKTSSETSSKTASSSEASSSATETATASKTDSADESATSTDPSAPDATKDDNGKKNTGAIIGGTISGVAVLVAAIAVGIWLWRRKKGNKRQGPGLQQNPQFVSPVPQARQFEPVPTTQEMYQDTPQPPPAIRAVPAHDESEYAREVRTPSPSPRIPSPEPYSSAYGYALDAITGGPRQLDHDEVPLRRNSEEMEDFPHGFGSALSAIDEEESRPDSHGSNHPGARARGGGPFYQQNRGPSNLTWL
ncbi:Fc.00g092010.m01.CDS01 [Cosmosporella sp. VM-42]